VGFIDVKNKKGTGEHPPPAGCTSWLGFWEREKGKKAVGCEVLHCGGPADVGGHVVKAGEGPKEYILPMCDACNGKPEHEVFKAWESDLVAVR